MFKSRARQNGKSIIVTIPAIEVSAYNILPADIVELDVVKVHKL